jgi:hypothetical protein
MHWQTWITKLVPCASLPTISPVAKRDGVGQLTIHHNGQDKGSAGCVCNTTRLRPPLGWISEAAELLFAAGSLTQQKVHHGS